MSAVIVFVHFYADFSGNTQNAIIQNFKQMNTPASSELVIIEIDDASIRHFSEWPWPRSRYTALLEKLDPVKPKKVAFYIDFSAKTTQIDDFEFSRALKRGDFPVILSTHLHSASHANITPIAQNTATSGSDHNDEAMGIESPHIATFDDLPPLTEFA